MYTPKLTLAARQTSNAGKGVDSVVVAPLRLLFIFGVTACAYMILKGASPLTTLYNLTSSSPEAAILATTSELLTGHLDNEKLIRSIADPDLDVRTKEVINVPEPLDVKVNVDHDAQAVAEEAKQQLKSQTIIPPEPGGGGSSVQVAESQLHSPELAPKPVAEPVVEPWTEPAGTEDPSAAVADPPSASPNQEQRKGGGLEEVKEGAAGCKEDAGAVLYRNATWRAAVGRWLASCDGDEDVAVVEEEEGESEEEKRGSQDCPGHCRGKREGMDVVLGNCNRDLGECRCNAGRRGKMCEVEDLYKCNFGPGEIPFRPKGFHGCGGYCNVTTGLCTCGPGTPYPDRPAFLCGWKLRVPEGAPPDTPPTDDGVEHDDKLLYSNDTEAPGWCFAPTNGQPRPLTHCLCAHSLYEGAFCQIPTLDPCYNQCTGHGTCERGFCQCEEGWYGIDCSVPSAKVATEVLPAWRDPAKNTERVVSSDPVAGVGGVRSSGRRRPLVYVYDLPTEFNTQFIQQRQYGRHCRTRAYGYGDSAHWDPNLYGAETALIESMLASPHRTTNGDEADFFFVPMVGCCMIERADDSPRLTMEPYQYCRQWLMADVYRKAWEHIVSAYPFWSRNHGKDHLWSFFWDEGACSAPWQIWNSTMLVHWANTEAEPRRRSQYGQDKWDNIPESLRGKHPCYEPDKDIALPAYKVLEQYGRNQFRTIEERQTLFYFNGNLGIKFRGRYEDGYSWGIRQKVADLFASSPNVDGVATGSLWEPGVIVTEIRSQNYLLDLGSSRFCGAFPGDGWSGRTEDSVLHGCIPVIIQDGIHMPFENVLDYDSFAVRIPEANISDLITILKAIPESEVRRKQERVAALSSRFFWASAMRPEAKRQTAMGARNLNSWIDELDKLEGDDVIDTLFQVLHYKLHNDKWRKAAKSSRKNPLNICQVSCEQASSLTPKQQAR